MPQHQHFPPIFHPPKFSVMSFTPNQNSNNPNSGSDSSSPWRATNPSGGSASITVFTIFADCRKRVDPPMPESYFGNLIQAIFTGTAAGLLLANRSRWWWRSVGEGGGGARFGRWLGCSEVDGGPGGLGEVAAVGWFELTIIPSNCSSRAWHVIDLTEFLDGKSLRD